MPPDLQPQFGQLQQQFGQIDIYVFDQILRGKITPNMRILDAGCGYGRNLIYLMQQHAEIFAIDQSPDCIDHLRQLAQALANHLPPENFQVAAIEQMPFPDQFADVVICNSVLHFASDQAHFQAMLLELWRVLRPNGLFFCRLGSSIGSGIGSGLGSGIGMDFEPLGGGLYRIGDGSAWYLVDEAKLMQLTAQLNAQLVDPLKTTVVQNHRCMTTWVLRKS